MTLPDHASLPISTSQLAVAVDELIHGQRPRLARLWAYYRNPMRALEVVGDERPYRQAQEWGLPTRITGFRAQSTDGALRVDQVRRKEVVIENDIAWRIETMVEYLFGKSIVILSAAVEADRREQIGELLRQIIASNGGMIFLQQLALLSAVYGHVDVLVKLDLSAMARHERDAKPAASHHNSLDTQTLGRSPCSVNRSPAGLRRSTCLTASLIVKDEPAPGPTVGSDREAADGAALLPPPPLEAGATSDARPGAADRSTCQAPSAETPATSIDPVKSSSICADALTRLAGLVRFEMIEPARALPFLSPDDYRVVETYGQVFEVNRQATATNAAGVSPMAAGWGSSVLRSAMSRLSSKPRGDQRVRVIELLTATHWYRIENDKLATSGVNSLGQIPLVHVQNLSVPFEYSGVSEVEPLIPLQDELNTRLSDRAHRISLQSFKMYLGKNIDGFIDMPVAPGRMWATDNPDAQIIEFGGDTACPSEESHIAEIREALDKASGVSPVAAGGVKNKLGHLTSAAALLITMQSLLSKTEKKRITFGLAIGRLCELALAWLDAAGLFATTPDERKIEVHWPNPLPISETDALEEAQAKLKLGIPAEVVMRELGY